MSTQLCPYQYSNASQNIIYENVVKRTKIRVRSIFKKHKPIKHVFCDGSFAITPTLFGQAFVILGKKGQSNFVFPLACGL